MATYRISCILDTRDGSRFYISPDAGTYGNFPMNGYTCVGSSYGHIKIRGKSDNDLPIYGLERRQWAGSLSYYSDVIMGAMASQITSLAIVYSSVYSGVDQRKHQSSAPLAFVRGLHRWPVNSPHKKPVTRKMFPLDDVITIGLYGACPYTGVHSFSERSHGTTWNDIFLKKYHPFKDMLLKASPSSAGDIL